jgi:hypothetical protein
VFEKKIITGTERKSRVGWDIAASSAVLFSRLTNNFPLEHVMVVSSVSLFLFLWLTIPLLFSDGIVRGTTTGLVVY